MEHHAKEDDDWDLNIKLEILEYNETMIIFLIVYNETMIGEEFNDWLNTAYKDYLADRKKVKLVAIKLRG